jgi:uncharacterized lipoprotein YddW (UPF0748 family)
VFRSDFEFRVLNFHFIGGFGLKRLFGLICIIVIVASSGVQATSPPEHRDVWATAWGSAFESASATTSYINYIRDIHANVAIPELRLRCDAYYDSEIEPPGTGVTPALGYDSLADLITKGHANGIEIHPWAVAFRIWTTNIGPGYHMTPEHMWWTHGPGGTNDWTMLDSTGNWDFGGTSNLDPGHPAVEDYLVQVYMDMISRYDLDGFTLDYIRYPGTAWGYNPVAVARFNAEYGRTGSPSSSDTTWSNWRRDQVSNIVKRLYLETKAIKPWVKIGAAVWHTAATGNNSYFQNWDSWMQNHWMDYVCPMMYTSNNSTYEGYLADADGRMYGHHIYPLTDASNSVSTVLAQIALVRAYGFPGVGLYAYQSIPDKNSLRTALTTGGGPFVDVVAPTAMPWLDTPTKGYLKGFVRNGSGNAIYPVTVTILPSNSSKNTGTGFYGFSEVTPGSYTVRAEAPGYLTAEQPVTITAGVVSDLDFVLASDTTAPIISNVRAENIQATNVQIKWDTNEDATSQVDYGPDAGYGTTTTEDMARVTTHVVQLTSLTPLATYHYRVRSYDAGRNMTESTDYTFTTTNNDIPGSIIVDNSDATGVTLGGSWFTGTSSTDKYGSNYYYCSIAGGTKTCTWRPNVIVAGNYNVYAWWPEGTNRTPNAPFIVHWDGGSHGYYQDQRTNGGKWNLLVANVPFAVGTTGYVQVSNTNIQPTNVMADAIKIEPVDTQAPTDPTNLSATAQSATSMSLSWSPSTDNVGVAGYRVYRAAVEIGTSASTNYADSGLTANTQYSYYVKAFDAAQNLSGASNTVPKYTLSVAPILGSVTCDKTVNTWQASPTFTFTAVGGFGAGTIQSYKYAWNQNATHSWTGFEPSWTSGTSAQTATSTGSWYFHVKGFNGDGVENGNYDYGPYKYDGTAPVISNLNDYGPYTDCTGQLHATWSGSDPESGCMEYQYAIGTDPDNLGDWTSTGTGTSFTTTGLTLDSGTTYYIGVKGQNGVGTWSTPVISQGVTAADVVDSIVQAKELPDTKAVMLNDRLVSASYGSFYYICEGQVDQISGLRIGGGNPDPSDLVDVSGILDTVNGERVLTAPYTVATTGPGTPSPLFMINRAVGGQGVTDNVNVNNVGLLIAIAGRVYDGPSGYFLVGGGLEGTLQIKVDASMLVSPPSAGQHVRVIGICSTEESGGVVTPVLIPRDDSDVAQYAP